MKITLGLAFIIALMIFAGAVSALNGYLQEDKDLIAYGLGAFLAGTLFTILGSLKKEAKTDSKDESIEGGYGY